VRKIVGKLGALICILFFVSLLDSCIARVREPLFTVHLLPGLSEPVEGQLDYTVKSVAQLRVETSSPSVQLTPEKFQSGFWFGGNMWIGVITAADDAKAGTYDMRVFDANVPDSKPVAAYRAIVYQDYAALRDSYYSVIHRTFDVRPWMVALCSLPALGLMFGTMYLLSWRVERLLAAKGLAEVFQVQKVDEGIELWFGLGKKHGVDVGMQVTVSTDSGSHICTATVLRTDDENGIALADARAERLPKGAVVSLSANQSSVFRG
jgi:hypothetical protein